MSRNKFRNFLSKKIKIDAHGRKQKRYYFLYYFLLVASIIFISQFDKIFMGEFFFGYTEGDIVEKDFTLARPLAFIDQEATEKKIKLAMELILPVYVVKDDISARILNHYDELYTRLNSAKSDQDFENLLAELESRYPGIQYLEHLRDMDSLRLELILSESGNLLKNILEKGLVSHLNESRSGATGLIEVVHSDTGRKITQTVENTVLMDTWQESLRGELENLDFTLGESRFIEILVYYFLEPNCFFSVELTDLKMQEILKNVSPVWIQLNPGELLLARDTVVTAFEMAKINAYMDIRGRLNPASLASPFLYTLLIFILGAILFISFPRTTGLLDNIHLLFFLSWFHLVTALLLFRFLSVPGAVSPVLFIPTALVCFILSLLRNQRETIAFALIQSLFLFFVLGFHSRAMYMTFFTGIAAGLVIEGAEKRIDLIRDGLILGLIEMFLSLLMMLILPVSLSLFLISLGVAALNGIFSGFISLMVLPLFEHILNPCTTFRLQELADLNTPVLKRMQALAPGTYSHSMNVATLSEGGCRDIGANALLARVGAYYHDMGKIEQAKYFTENQKDYNKHDDMKTSLSVAVIKSHVKIGVEMAHKLNFPREVIEIIAQHHGTSVIEFFYQQAIKEKGIENVSLEDYSHAGPRPQSKEAAVVMLADMAEAATKSMAKPTVNKLEKFLWDLMMARFKDGELNECGMTLVELERVKTTFVHILIGHYHNRIEYPDRAEREEHGKS